MPLECPPLDWKPDRGTADSYSRIREQARIQVDARETGENNFEVLPVEDGFGLTRLPVPSDGDIFFDLEGDPFVGEHGLEYLFGYMFTSEHGQLKYHSDWAFTRADEKLAFEHFVDFVIARWEKYPGLHIYHYAPYEADGLERFLACGDLHHGFARLYCDQCGRDYLLAYSCKTRYFCPSCHQQRILAYGE